MNSKNSSQFRVRCCPAKLMVLVLAATTPAASASAGQTAYRYDALGRLERVSQSASPADYTATYAYDKAGNRTSYVVQAAATAAPATTGVVVVPSGGTYRVVPFRRP